MTDIEEQKKHFKNHIAMFQDLGKIKILDFKNPESCSYFVRFLFDESLCKLHISGDLGELTATNYSNMTYKGFWDFVVSPTYFIRKIDCCSRKIYEYNEEKAVSDLKKYFKEYNWIYQKEGYGSLDECMSDILEDFTTHDGINQNGFEILSRFEPDAWEFCSNIGKKSTGIIELYLLAFELAVKQLKEAEK